MKSTIVKRKSSPHVFKGPTPDPHQVISIAHAKANPKSLDFSDPGTGKTPVDIWDTVRVLKDNPGKKALVVCPRTLTEAVWGDELRKFAPHLSYSVAKAENREKAFAADADVYITNTDAVSWLVKQPKKFFAKFIKLTIDESSAFKHHTSLRSRAAKKISKHFTHARLLSGTPAPRSITDIWHQVKLVDDDNLLPTSFFAFRNSVCTPVQKGNHPQAIAWEDKEGAPEAVFGLIAPITVRHVFDDVVKIPERSIIPRYYDLPPKAAKAYHEMAARQVIASVGDKKRLATISAVNAAVLRGKLLQIASGAAYADRDSETPQIVFDTGRYELVMDLALEQPHSLAMFLWAHQRDELVREAKNRKLAYEVIDGNTSDNERLSIARHYQAGAFDVLLAHPQTVAHGLTLTAGTSTIWASPTDNTEWWLQGSRRQARRGQTKQTRVVTVMARGTVDELAYENCITKKDRQDGLLDLFAQYTKD